jgi:hypothetical protein
MKQHKQEWIKDFDEKVIGNCFAGGTFMDNKTQRAYTNGFKDGFEKAKNYSKQFISSLLLSQRKEVIGEIIEEINTTNIESNFGLEEDLVESIKILLINNLNKLK